MKNKSQQKLIRDIRNKLVKHYKPEKVILFGSRAYGLPQSHSDYDLFIVKRTRKRKVERMRDVSDIFTPRNFSLDVIVSTPSEVSNKLSAGDYFYKEIINRGKVLYERQ